MAEKIITTEYSEEIQKSYMDYPVSVIMARVISGARNDPKPVQRHVLYDMNELYINHDKPHKKSARIVGDTMGKHHPHDNNSVYETLMVMSQMFEKGVPLVNGHGNFGSTEGDGTAAMRYTEARLGKFAEEVCLKDLNKTVDFMPDYDGTEKEPEVLPIRVPNLSINGAEGIAVDISTSIPPHNLGKAIDAVMAYTDKSEIAIRELMEYLSGPDFPTGGTIANKSESAGICETGSGEIKLHGKLEVELRKRKPDKGKLVITEILYTMVGTGVSECLVDTVELVESKKLTDMTDISNQSNKRDIRIVPELKKNADVEKVINILYKRTKLKGTFGVNILTIASGRSETLNLKGILRNYLKFQYQNTTRRYRALPEKKLEKKETWEGLIKTCSVTSLIIAIPRDSKNLKDAKARLMNSSISSIKLRTPGSEEGTKKLQSTEKQAPAILEIRLYKLIGPGILTLEKEYKETLERIEGYTGTLENKRAMGKVIKEDLAHIKEEFVTPRGTVIEDGKEAVYEEAPVGTQKVIFIMDKSGCCKLLDKNAYDRNRETVEAERPHVIVCMNIGKICLSTNLGSLHQVKVMEVPFGKLQDKGAPIDSLSKFDGIKEEIICLINLEGIHEKELVSAMKMTLVKQVPVEEFETNNRTVTVIKLQDRDGLTNVQTVEQQTEVMFWTNGDVLLRFALDETSETKKNSRGIRDIKLMADEKLEHLYLLGEESVIMYKKKEVHLNRLKIDKRDGKSSKMRLSRNVSLNS